MDEKINSDLYYQSLPSLNPYKKTNILRKAAWEETGVEYKKPLWLSYFKTVNTPTSPFEKWGWRGILGLSIHET